MAALSVIALDTTTPQLRAPASGDTYSAPRAMAMTPETLTGSSATSSLSIAQTWNTTGTPTAIDLNVTDTASNAASLLMNLRVGGTSRFYFTKDGAIAFGSDADSYLKAAAADGRTIDWIRDNTIIMRLGAVCGFATSIGIGTNGAAQDVILARDAANTLAQRNGVNAQTLRVYGTFTDASNYERLSIGYSAGVSAFVIQREQAGTGAQRALYLNGGSHVFGIGAAPSGAYTWTIAASGGHLVAGVDNTYDIGASGANRPRDLWIANQIYAGNGVRADGANGLQALSGPISAIGANGRLELAEVSAPAAPSADRVRIFAQDNGAGKTQLMALFATGAAQQIAIEP